MLITSAAFAEQAESQNARVDISARNSSTKEVMEQIENQTDYLFVYNTAIDLDRKVSMDMKDSPVADVLSALFSHTGIVYAMEGNNILLMKKDGSAGSTPGTQQAKKVNGVILDKAGVSVIGANVVVKGQTSYGVTSDLDGKFTIEVPPDAVLVVSFIGYMTQEVPVGGQTDLTITLRENTQALEEVVVVGYGVQKKANLTGAVSSIDFEKEAASRPVTTLSTALSGLSAGLQVMQGSATPNGDGASIRIRGTGTLNTADPLILVDGFEESMSNVNPNDVASISVLKDAASCAIYGNRGANGVILITTKEGEKGKIHVNYRGVFSFNQPSNLIEMVSNSADYMELMNESSTNVGQAEIFSDQTINQFREAEKNPHGLSETGYPNYVAYPNTDWYDAVFQDKVQMEHTVAVTGATDKVNFNFSGTYQDNPGLIDGSGIKKYFIRSNVAVHVTDWLTVGNKTWGFQKDAERNSVGDALGGLGFQKIVPGIYPYYDGKYGAPEAKEEDPQSHNALWDIESTGGSYAYSQVNTSMFADIKFLKDFLYKVNFNYKRYWTEQTYTTKGFGKYSFSQGQDVISPVPPSQLKTMSYFLGSRTWKFENTLNWNRTFAKAHDIGALLGYEEMRYTTYNADNQKSGLIDPSITDLSTATEMLAINGNNSEYSARSVFGRLTYAYKSRYLFETDLRYDGSSRFSSKSRWGLFPSFSAGWRIAEEDFMQNAGFDNLKLRVSWGKLGNNSIGNYDWQSTYSPANYSFGGVAASGLAATTIANPSLEWETTTITDVGLDAAILNNRLTAEFDFYHKLTDGILYRPTIYSTMGEKTAPYENIAEVTNNGVELTLGWRDHIGPVEYGISGNMAFNKNEVSKYKGKLQRGWVTDEAGNKVYKTNLGDVSTGGMNRIVEGRMINDFYMLSNYKGDGSYFNADGTVNVKGGPKNGMIRTEADMKWLQAMMDAGHKFYPNQTIGKSKIWYGDYIYADRNGDGVYGNSEDKDFQNFSTVPKYNFGVQAYASWKGFDFSMNWAGAAGFRLYWYVTGQNGSATNYGYAIPQSVADDHYFFDPEHPDDPRTNQTSDTPRLSRNTGSDQSGQQSTLHLENGNFIKLKNLTLGYSIPKDIAGKLFAQNIRVYFSGENLLTITKFKGMDPEMRTGIGYVSMRQLALGLNVTF